MCMLHLGVYGSLFSVMAAASDLQRRQCNLV